MFNQDKFNELFSKPENLLSVDTNTYHYLLFFTLASKDLSQHAPVIYEKYLQYHGFSCEVENNIAIHYFNSEQFEKSADHVKQALNKSSKCLNPLLIELLNEKGLLEIVNYLIDNGANINHQNGQGLTPAMKAAQKSNFLVVKLLLDKNIDLTISDFTGRTLREISENSRDKRILKLLNEKS